MAIRIIKGIYGYRDSNGNIIPKTREDVPFDLSEAQEARLVKRGVAEYVQEDKEENCTVEVQETNEEINVSNDESEVELDDLSYAKLKHLAKEYGISATGKKEDLLKAIENAKEEFEEDAEDDEEPPTLAAADPE